MSQTLSGWGRTSASAAEVLSPHSGGEVAALLRGQGDHGVIARGAGRSYGDAAQNAGGAVLQTAALRDFALLGLDPPLARAGAGLTLGELLARLAESGLTLPVLPGTRHVTVGGAIAADVHGKNHRRDGSFGHHLASFTLCTPGGELVEVSREHEPDLFAASIGGMGLTGVIVDATLRVRAAASPVLEADVDRAASVSEAIAIMRQGDHRYAIAWLDLLASGRRFGRSTVVRSEERPLGADGGEGRSDGDRGERIAVALPGRPRLRVPGRWPSGGLPAEAVRVVNALRWHATRSHARCLPVAMGGHFFPLDAIAGWNRLYGAGGLVQYQFAVPDAHVQLVEDALGLLRDARLPMYLAVLKRLGQGSGGLLSFPLPGWTLAIDFPADAPGLSWALTRLDEQVAAAGGRVYLAKDGRLAPEMLAAMYPQLERFRQVRQRIDPDGLLRSDMAIRLGLTEGAG